MDYNSLFKKFEEKINEIENIEVLNKKCVCRSLFALFFVTVCGIYFIAIERRNIGTTPARYRHDDMKTYVPTRAEDKCTIKTEGCSIEHMQAYEVDLMKFIERPHPINCSRRLEDALTGSNRTSFWIIYERLAQYNVADKMDLSCCYKYFRRPTSVKNIQNRNLDNAAEYTNCLNFTSVVHALEEMVHIECKYNDTLIYDDYYIFPIVKKLAKHSTVNATEFNVLVLGIDSVSRLNFHRTMPKTLNYLKSLDAVEFLGYNKVADNTYPNLVPVLCGLWKHDMRRKCLPRRNSVHDNCPFIWNLFKNAGFVTAFAEDTVHLSTFNYQRAGFMRKPTDYYWRTFLHEVVYGTDKKDQRAKDQRYRCLNNRFLYDVMLEYAFNFADAMRFTRYFGFFWEVSMSHDSLNRPMLIDKKYTEFLKDMKANSLLHDTIIILMSDHGMRWGGIESTKQGKLESRLPLLIFLLPDRFKQSYRMAHENLLMNKDKLTTPFDLHETLRDLASVNSVADEAVRRRMLMPYANDRGISLFLPMPGNRTCISAEISDHWCACRQTIQLERNTSLAQHVAVFTVSYLNHLLSQYPQCATLKLNDVIELNRIDLHPSIWKTERASAWLDYGVVVRTDPGGAVFEATLRRDLKEDWFMTGTVSRLNLYGNQSYCIDDPLMKLYCFCGFQ